ncbi:UDP-glucose glucosyltransferase, partial [Striga asiatica]
MDKPPVTVVMLPVPAQSHLNQLLRLAGLISSATTLPVHFLGSATHNRQVKLRHYSNPNPNPIHFHDFPTPPIPTPDPDPSSHRTPNHLAPAMEAYIALRRPIAALIQNMSTQTKKIVLIYDRFIAEAVEDSVSIPNVESYAFNCFSAFNLFHILREHSTTKPFPLKVKDKNLSFSVHDYCAPEIINFIVSRPEHFKNRAGDIHNTIRLIEGEYSRKMIELPEGFEERVKGAGIGLVVRDWAPQVEILAHEATGGFLTHCGWNLCFESLMTGVPVLAWPMHSDQPVNAIFMTKVLKTGLAVRDWEKREELVRAGVVKDAVGRLMAAGEEGDEIRRRAAEIGVGESYAFNCLSAFCDVKLTHELAGILCPVPALRHLPLISASISDDLQVFIGGQYPALQRSSGSLYNTCRAMEGPFLDILEAQGGRKVWAVGPMLAAKSVGSGSGKRHGCLEWLDGQKVGSVLYVTFGTTCSLTDEEITELALGLESSGHGFLWVLRDADKADVFDRKVRNVQLPSGFEERMKGKGLVVRDWAPQTEILAHGSTGGFMSHCGWNSCIESIVAGVPIAAWPMHSDQPTNAKLVTEILKVGLPVREWSKTREVVKASTIENAVRCLMASEDLRKRARDLAATVRGAMEEGGESKLELDSFIAHISRKD